MVPARRRRTSGVVQVAVGWERDGQRGSERQTRANGLPLCDARLAWLLKVLSWCCAPDRQPWPPPRPGRGPEVVAWWRSGGQHAHMRRMNVNPFCGKPATGRLDPPSTHRLPRCACARPRLVGRRTRQPTGGSRTSRWGLGRRPSWWRWKGSTRTRPLPAVRRLRRPSPPAMGASWQERCAGNAERRHGGVHDHDPAINANGPVAAGPSTCALLSLEAVPFGWLVVFGPVASYSRSWVRWSFLIVAFIVVTKVIL